jgi:cation diffusion facilitator CzcD-associated flavoprotein CzcO
MNIVIVGAGNVGRALGGGWLKTGHKVTMAVRERPAARLSNSRSKASASPQRRTKRPSDRRAAEKSDELTAFQWIECIRYPPARGGLQDIELARISQEVMERFYNLLAAPARC